MTSDRDRAFAIIGYFCCVASAFTGLLLIMNIRSRVYHHGPNYGFLFWVFVYFLVTGIGQLKQKKWSVILLFGPAIAYAVAIALAIVAMKRSVFAPWFWFNVLVFTLLGSAPFYLLRRWNGLKSRDV